MLELLAAGEEFIEPKAFGFITPGVAVALAMVVVFVIMWRAGVPGMITGGLDAKIDAIRKQLDEAKQLREEAAALKAEYEKKTAAAGDEIAEIRASAERQAEEIVEKAKVDAKILVERRKRLAEEKIAAAERAAVEELRATVASAASQASRELIDSKHGEDADRKLADDIISSI